MLSSSIYLLEADESSERCLIQHEFYAATEVITSYIFKDLLHPLLSTMETTFRDHIEASESTLFAHMVSTFEEGEAAPAAPPLYGFDGWERTRAQISQREQNCFMELTCQYRKSLSLSASVITQEREARTMLKSFWNRGVQVLFSSFAQSVKCSHIMEALSQMAVEVQMARGVCGIDAR